MTSSLFQSKPIRGDDELTLLPYLGPDLLLLCDTAREAACALHMGARVTHTHTHAEASSPVWMPLTDFFLLLSWCFGIYQASAPSSIIHNLSSVSLYPSVCVSTCTSAQCVCVWLRYALSGSLGSHDPASPLSEAAFPLCFLEHGLLSVDIRRAGTRCFICGH